MSDYDDYGMPVGGAYSEPESLTHQAWRVARAFFLYRVKPKFSEAFSGGCHWRKIFSLGRILVLVWWISLYVGERYLFESSIDSCRWENWENWYGDANPHRLVFVADPQLVDPHTYPGRPWPLSTLTVIFTDQYIRRTYSRIQKVLYPDTVALLGDLFDGGREWSTRTTQSPEQQWRKYGNKYWLGEYDRFGKIFFGHWRDGGSLPRDGQPGRKILSSLPGNHDLGFGKGVQTSVRKRFNAYFGDGNRIDIIGNHTFVSIDGLSLSALGQANPEAGEDLWRPTWDFLEGAKKQKQRLVQEELRVQQGLPRTLPFVHDIVEAHDLAKAELPKLNDTVTEFPTILLTHVPLYRPEGTPCGPLRERWPPTPPKNGEGPLEKDERNAIAIQGGYQYWNVLTRDLSRDIADKIGDIQYAFSGDDHDYCEVVHRGYASGGGGIRETTVKSISWAMGIRHPGVVMMSMWNPVDEKGNSRKIDSSGPTVQTHLCLLPDQLGTFIRYAMLFGATILLLCARAILVASGTISTETQTTDIPLLPITSAEGGRAETTYAPRDSIHESTSSNSSSTSDERGNLQVRIPNSRNRSVSPNSYALPQAQAKYSFPLIQHAGYYGSEDEDKKESKTWGTVSTKKKKPKKTGCALFVQEFGWSILGVGFPVFALYFWLIWRW